MNAGDCPPGYIRTALGNCIKDPAGSPEWEHEEATPLEEDPKPYAIE